MSSLQNLEEPIGSALIGFCRQAARSSGAPAAIYGDNSTSYEELERDSSRLALHLRASGVRSGDIVGIALRPSFDLVIAILAVWKTGAAYLPLEPAYPAERLISLINEAQAACVLTHSSMAQPFTDTARIVHIDSPWREYTSAQQWAATAATTSDPDALAYVLYTSGSTGKPRGVAVSHRALASKLMLPGTWDTVTSECRAALLTSIAFDASLAHLFLPLTHGGTVLLLDEDERLDPVRVWSRLRAAGVNVLDCTPSWLLMMLESAPDDLPLKRIVLGGEVLTPSLASRVRAKFPRAKLVNIYGPTEACIDALAHEVTAEDLNSDLIPIGRPLPGYRVHVLDADMQSVASGQIGELYIGGVGVALGYWRNPQATAARFLPDPFDHASSCGGERLRRLYRTGDLARCRADGCIEFLGRADHQIKLRGQRIELGEIEATLARFPEVLAAAVQPWSNSDADDVRLCAYVVPRDAGLQAGSIRERLKQQLPSAMVPNVVLLVDRLPLLANGKVDRKALPPPALQSPCIDSLDLPRDELERTLAEIWCEVLHLERVGIHDNFFALGGDSLSMVRLLVEINARFKADLSLNALLAQLTIADLAIALLRRDRRGDLGRALQLASHIGNRSPLFLAPPVTGIGLVYAGLARELKDVLPVVALQAVGFDDVPPGRVSMKKLAGEFVKEIERIQPNCPVRLGGYSAGGAVVHEMARQLLERGRAVDQIFLFDPYSAEMANAVIGVQPIDTPDAFWAGCADMIWDAIGTRGAAAEPLLRLAQRVWNCVQAEGNWNAQSARLRALADEISEILPANVGMEVFLLLMEGFVNLWHAFANHAPQPLPRFDGQIWILQPDGDDEPTLRRERDDAWRRLFGAHIHCELVPGYHGTLLSRAHTVAALGAQLRNALQGQTS